MKPTALLLIGTSFAFVSCASMDPEYAAWKKEQEAQANGQGGLAASTDPYAPQGSNPYAPQGSNPYGVPGAGISPGSEVGSYTPANPYQPLPGIPSDTPNAVAPRTGFPTIPSPGGSAGTTTTHIVAQGDSLWGLSRKYGTSIEAIKQANGMTNDTVILGSTLQIPR
jgi:nucleoid-associated protein YgaU